MSVQLNTARIAQAIAQPAQASTSQALVKTPNALTLSQDTYEGPASGQTPAALVDKYNATTDGSSFTKSVMEFLIRLTWKMGSSSVFENPKRLTTDSVTPILDQLKPGDIILNGSGGGLTHAAVYTGNGEIIHSMATNTTGRGFLGAVWDTVKRTFGHQPENVGVLKEKLGDFFDRYPRDTMVVMRDENLSTAQRNRGVENIDKLVGQGYDYDFTAGDDTYYCTEIGIEFLKAAQGQAPTFNTTHHSVPMIWSSDVVEPPNMYENQSLTPVLASETAREQWSSSRPVQAWFA
jgi:hypothetical protein